MAEVAVNLTDPRMLAILKGANKLIKKVETGDYEKGNINPDSIITEGHDNFITEDQALAQGIVKPIRKSSNSEISLNDLDDETYAEQVKRTKLPAAIQEIMIKKRIETPTSLSPVNLDTVKAFLNEDGEKQFKPRTPNTKPIAKTVINENNHTNNGDRLITIGENQLKGLVKDAIAEFFTNEYNKTLTEQTIAKTINLLIKEGKIGMKKKV